MAAHLEQLLWATAQCLAQRACMLDARLRELACAGAAEELRSAAALVSPPLGQPSLYPLVGLCAQLVSALVSHPLARQLLTSASDAAGEAGMSRELQQLQPLDVRYDGLLLPYTPGIPAAVWAGLQQRAARLRALQRALCWRLLLQHVMAGADAAVAGGQASALQMSYWRFLWPEERCVVGDDLSLSVTSCACLPCCRW